MSLPKEKSFWKTDTGKGSIIAILLTIFSVSSIIGYAEYSKSTETPPPELIEMILELKEKLEFGEQFELDDSIIVSTPYKILENEVYGFSVLVPEEGVWDFVYDRPTTSSLDLDQISNHVNTITVVDRSQHRNLEEIIQIEITTGQKFRHPKDLEKLIDDSGSKFTYFSSTVPNSVLTHFEYFFDACDDIGRGGLNCKILGHINIQESKDVSYIIHTASFADRGDPEPEISDEAKLILNSFKIL